MPALCILNAFLARLHIRKLGQEENTNFVQKHASMYIHVHC